MKVSDVKFFEEQLREQAKFQNEKYKELEEKYDILAKQYEHLQKQYIDVLQTAKECADSYEYCIKELEKDYEKAIQKLIELGAYNV